MTIFGRCEVMRDFQQCTALAHHEAPHLFRYDYGDPVMQVSRVMGPAYDHVNPVLIAESVVEVMRKHVAAEAAEHAYRRTRSSCACGQMALPTEDAWQRHVVEVLSHAE